MTFFHLRTLLKQPNHAQVNRWTWLYSDPKTNSSDSRPTNWTAPAPSPPKKGSFVMVLSHQISSRFGRWVEGKKRLHPLFLGRSNLNLKRPNSWEILLSSLHFFQPQSYSCSFKIWIEGKPQANKILFVWVMFFLFPKDWFWETNLQTTLICLPLRHILDPSRHSQESGRRGSPRGRLSCRMVHVTPSTCQS